MNIKQWIAEHLSTIIKCKFNPDNQSGVIYFHRVLAVKDKFYPDDPTVDEFDDLIGMLKTAFHIVPLREIVTGDVLSDKPSIAITFDDGYLDNKTLAAKILNKHNVTATFFIATEGIDNGILWQDKVVESFRQSTAYHLDKMGFSNQGKSSDRITACAEILSRLKRLSPHLRDKEVDLLVSQVKPEFIRLMMKREDIQSLHNAGHTIGAHSVGHDILTTLNDEQASYEILHSKRVLEDIISSSVDIFCYPNGYPIKDFTTKHQEMVKEAGFTSGFSTQDGGISKRSNRYSMPRFLPHRKGALMRTLSSAKIMGESM